MSLQIYYITLLIFGCLTGLSTQQCQPSAIGKVGDQCFVDPSFGTNLEYAIVVYEYNAPDSGNCLNWHFYMKAVYTGVDSVVTTELSPNIVQLEAPGPQTMFFPFRKAYSNLLQDGVVSFTATYSDPTYGSVTIGAGVMTIHQTATIVYGRLSKSLWMPSALA
jgi:hypothetical protein